MSEHWTEKDVMENAILDLQHERDDLKAELESRDEKIAELEAIVSPASFRKFLVEQIKDPELAEAYVKACIQDTTYKELLARRDEIITRLKEDGERMADFFIEGKRGNSEVFVCIYCDAPPKFQNRKLEHEEYCPVSKHDALMKELE